MTKMISSSIGYSPCHVTNSTNLVQLVVK